MDRVFLDANVLFSAAYRSDSGLRRLWELAEVVLLSSEYAVAEARHNLSAGEQRERLDALIRDVKIVNESAEPEILPRDVKLPVKDRPILAAAIQAKATHLLTGDKTDFGELFGRCIGGVKILRPAEYLRMRDVGAT